MAAMAGCYTRTILVATGFLRQRLFGKPQPGAGCGALLSCLRASWPLGCFVMGRSHAFQLEDVRDIDGGLLGRCGRWCAAAGVADTSRAAVRKRSGRGVEGGHPAESAVAAPSSR